MALIQPTSVETITPNAVYAPSIVFNARIVDGKLKTIATIMFKQAEVSNYGEANETWKDGVKVGHLTITDIENLPADLSSMQSQVTAMYEGLKTMLGAVNTVRQIV